jgi:hypothetical protein
MATARRISRVSSLDDLLRRLEELLAEVDDLDEPVRQAVFELLDGIDTIHRLALDRLARGIGPEAVQRLRESDQAVAWLFDAYGIGVDELAAAEEALASIRPYIHSHGGQAGRGPPADVGCLLRLLRLGDHPQGGDRGGTAGAAAWLRPHRSGGGTGGAAPAARADAAADPATPRVTSVALGASFR